MRAAAVRAAQTVGAAFCLTLVCLSSAAFAEDLGLEKLNLGGFDAVAFLQKLISGDVLSGLVDPGQLWAILRQGVRDSLYALAMNLALPVTVCVLLRLVIRRSDTDFMLNLLCALCCGTALAETWRASQRQATALMDVLLNATEAMTPVLTSAAALTGGAFRSAAIAPLASLCASFVQQALNLVGLRLCTCAAVIALCGALIDGCALDRLFELLKSAARWLLGGAVFVYGALVSAQGLVSAAKDGAAVQTAKAAIESVVPIIGGGLSDVTGALAVSAGLLRSAVGITGVALIVKLCAGPMLALGGRAVALKLIAAAMEPLADGAAVRLIGRFGDILETLLAIAICAAVLTAMLPAGFAITLGSMAG